MEKYAQMTIALELAAQFSLRLATLGMRRQRHLCREEQALVLQHADTLDNWASGSVPDTFSTFQLPKGITWEELGYFIPQLEALQTRWVAEARRETPRY